MNPQSDTVLQRCRNASCRSCGACGVECILDLGSTPLADALVSVGRLGEPELCFPLEIAFCPKCTLVQIVEDVPPDVLFSGDYLYYSSFSETTLAHARDLAKDLIDRRQLDGGSFVVEIASNDGYLLRNFVARGIPCLGIDPAAGQAAAAAEAGVPVLRSFFNRKLSEQLRADGRCADVIVANNVLAHVDDLNGFVAGVAHLLKPEGVASIEVPYVRNMIGMTEFDTIYHEHRCYFSMSSLAHLFARHGLGVRDAHSLSAIHGGSLRLTVGRGRENGPAAEGLCQQERQAGMGGFGFYREFSQRVEDLRRELLQLLGHLKASGARLAAYGAAAKGSTLLNYLGIATDLCEFVVDRNVYKQGKLMPGVGIPILDPTELLRRMPDYVLLLAWNFADEICRQQEEFLNRGGRFIVPIPRPTILPFGEDSPKGPFNDRRGPSENCNPGPHDRIR